MFISVRGSLCLLYLDEFSLLWEREQDSLLSKYLLLACFRSLVVCRNWATFDVWAFFYSRATERHKKMKSLSARVDSQRSCKSPLFISFQSQSGTSPCSLPQSKVITISNSFGSFTTQHRGFELEPNEKIKNSWILMSLRWLQVGSWSDAGFTDVWSAARSMFSCITEHSLPCGHQIWPFGLCYETQDEVGVVRPSVLLDWNELPEARKITIMFSSAS